MKSGPAVFRSLKRGEIWTLPHGGTAVEIVEAARELRMDFCFFNGCPDGPELAHAAGLAAGAVVSGPWQRWTAETGWETALRQLGGGGPATRGAMEQAAEQARREAGAALDSGADMILLADDLAHAGGPFFDPRQFEEYLLPFYLSLCQGFRDVPVGFHADGNVGRLLPFLGRAGFAFFSLEPERTDPLRAWEILDAPVPLFSGLPAEWLLPGRFAPEREGALLRRWLAAGPLILASACGLYHVEAAQALSRIYAWIDREKIF